MSQNLWQLTDSRQSISAAAVVEPATAAKSLIDWDHTIAWHSPGLGRSNIAVDHVVVTALQFRSARVRADTEQVDVRIARVVGACERRRLGRRHDHEKDECLGAGYVGVNPVGLSRQTFSCAESAILARWVRVVHEIEPKQLSIADIGPDGVQEGRIDAIALANPHEAIDTVRQCVQLRHAADVCQVETNAARQIVSAGIEVAIESIVESA